MKTSKMAIFFILYFFFSVCINIVHPVTTTYVDSLNLPNYYFGFFFALMSLGQVIGAFIFGFLSDKIGRKWLIVMGIIGYCLAQFGFGFINTYPILILVFRVLAGIFVAAPNTLFISLCLDYSTPEKKIRWLSMLTSFSILGASLGYEVGGSLYNYFDLSIQQVFIAQMILGGVISLIFALTMKDVIKPISTKVTTKKLDFSSFKSLNPIVIVLLLGLLVLTIGQILISKYLDVYIIHIGYDEATLGHYVLATGLVGAFSNLLLIPLIKKIKNTRLAICLLVFVLLSSGLTFITFSIKTNNIMILLCSTHMIYCIFKSLITPLEQNELSSYSNESNNGSIMGARQTILSIGSVVGPLLGSLIYIEGSSLVFIISGFIILLSFFIYLLYFLFKRKNENC